MSIPIPATNEYTFAPLAKSDVDTLIENMRAGVPYRMPDLYQRYANMVLFHDRRPSSVTALGRALKRRGLIAGRYQSLRTWMLP